MNKQIDQRTYNDEEGASNRLRVGHDEELSSFDALRISGIPSPTISSTAFRTSSTCSRYMLQRAGQMKTLKLNCWLKKVCFLGAYKER